MKFLIGAAIGFGVGWIVFKRPHEQLARQIVTDVRQSVQSQLPIELPDPKLQGFGYTKRWN